MTNCKIIDILNEKTENKFGFKMKNATLKQGGSICVLEIYYKDGVILSQENRQTFYDLIVENMPKGFEYDVRFIKNFVSSDSIIPAIEDYFEHNFPSFIHKIENVSVNGNEATINLLIDEKSFDRFESKRVQSLLKDYLSEHFCVDFTVNAASFVVKEEVEIVENDFDIDVPEPVNRTIDVTDVMKYLGEQIDDKPLYIKDVNKPTELAVVCGKITFYNAIIRKPKEKPVDEKDKKVEETPNEEETTEKKSKRKLFKKGN